ncbi:acetyltransferase [Oleiphilus sp. HI0071]|uniref:WS/DGAT/MGAT family O-acyltransferase n=2 Tax=Oleiphilus TaxID=141450 RepID=UPI0007C2B299|nr:MULTISPECIES: wax ester/triacylglycerol synthase family O-acyltransferase [unclassified Oleiphilus]KZY68905.1 acetyltransferase [Oleiphilus sp. HI0065]KZY82648.1 acetyltransferase [Oleiphilus sp. HI0071]KZY92643.1 acetyltransferase [Oleiphilus sp. HI0073]KZZ44579.1 acetyltransferase [Oleiphilus sp. HI0118]KZZ50581.1 acetyltransferase [Oleiphilus sp. HI0122]KZZ68793.1 acetyltransferase [Oleiphilus sp. HI0130]KZZ75748.1 acetyltransferase [Oleiphilus sp. HI0133]
MKPLSLADQLFLWMEKRQQPMHVGGLHLLNFPEGAGPKYVSELAEYMSTFQQPIAPFNQRLVQRFGRYYWHEDKQFDLEHHFRHSALPKPGRIRELLSLVSVKHSALMDRERPMWEVHLIEGIRGKQFALYYKVHHCMLDGVAAMRMGMRLMSEDPSVRDQPPLWAMPKKHRTHEPIQGSDVIASLTELAGAAGKQISTVPTLIKEVSHAVKQARSNPDYTTAFEAPPSILNQRITGSRRFAAQSYPIERFKAIAKKADATLNDVVMAVCGSALRNYLLSMNALPDKPLIAMVPMSMRKDDSEQGNQIAMILARLGTNISDPSERLYAIKRSVKESKDRYASMSLEEAINYTALTLAPAGLNMLTGVSSRLQAFNVVISNVPGPKKPLYWNGARVKGMYPVSIPIDRIALNITLVSYVDSLEFGFTACRRTLPSMQRLLDYVEVGIKELEDAVGRS